jgi:hypothetical protein
VGRGRFELPTSRLSSARSNQLSYRPVAFGGGDRDRTDDLLLAKQALSQLSYKPLAELSKPNSRGIASASATARRGSCRALAERQHPKGAMRRVSAD